MHMKVKFENKVVDGARLLMELHNHTRSIGLGVLHDKGNITFEDADRELRERRAFQFDYFRGRPLKCYGKYVSDGVYELPQSARALFDRDAGRGQFDRALAAAGAATESEETSTRRKEYQQPASDSTHTDMMTTSLLQSTIDIAPSSADVDSSPTFEGGGGDFGGAGATGEF